MATSRTTKSTRPPRQKRIPLPPGFVPVTVVNVRFEECDVYVGRSFGRFRSSDGFFGNPFKGDHSISKFEEYFFDRVETDPEFARRARALHGKRIGCWCVPGPCHAETLAAFADLERLRELGVDPRYVEGYEELDELLSREEAKAKKGSRPAKR